jgi:hypothetical protein
MPALGDPAAVELVGIENAASEEMLGALRRRVDNAGDPLDPPHGSIKRVDVNFLGVMGLLGIGQEPYPLESFFGGGDRTPAGNPFTSS